MWQGQEDGNVYETEITPAKRQGKTMEGRPREPLPAEPRKPQVSKHDVNDVAKACESTSFSKTSRNQRLILGVFITIGGILLFGSFCMTAILITQTSRVQLVKEPFVQTINNSVIIKTESKNPSQIEYCQGLKKKGFDQSGIYQVAIGVNNYTIEVFCDMTTDGGGWTLVASMHEDNINEKCDLFDRWSDRTTPSESVKTNWENKNTFGKANHSTIDDYKSEAYYNLMASDVMIWHVPSGTPTSNLKENSKLRYRTTNHFLRGEGRNLYGVFKDRYQLSKINRDGNVIRSRRTRRVVEALSANCDKIKNKIPNWQEYSYTGVDNGAKITDKTLYHNTSTGGNMISFYSSKHSAGIVYEKEQEILPDVVLNSKRSQPFFMAAVVSNEDAASTFFKTKVDSYLRATMYSSELLANDLHMGNFEIQYRSVHFHYANHISICEYHFVVFNKNDWGSRPPTSFNRTDSYHISHRYYNVFQADGSPTNFIMGYFLLSRTTNNPFSRALTDAVAQLILDAFATLTDLFHRDLVEDGLSVPVVFDKGDSTSVLNMIPPKYRPFVEPGFLQFRAYNMKGYANALCPGIKVKSFHPEYLCVGGNSIDVLYKYGTCGDFAGWGGRNTDILLKSAANGSAHALSDISSTILIFYR